jgi:hypothetical protein
MTKFFDRSFVRNSATALAACCVVAFFAFFVFSRRSSERSLSEPQSLEPTLARPVSTTLEKKLERIVSIDAHNQPLRRVLHDFEILTGIRCEVDEPDRVHLDRHVAFAARDVSALAALFMLLDPMNLEFENSGEMIRISSAVPAAWNVDDFRYAASQIVPDTLRWVRKAFAGDEFSCPFVFVLPSNRTYRMYFAAVEEPREAEWRDAEWRINLSPLGNDGVATIAALARIQAVCREPITATRYLEFVGEARIDRRARFQVSRSQSQNLRQLREEWARSPFADMPKHLTPERVDGGIMP